YTYDFGWAVHTDGASVIVGARLDRGRRRRHRLCPHLRPGLPPLPRRPRRRRRTHLLRLPRFPEPLRRGRPARRLRRGRRPHLLRLPRLSERVRGGLRLTRPPPTAALGRRRPGPRTKPHLRSSGVAAASTRARPNNHP